MTQTCPSNFKFWMDTVVTTKRKPFFEGVVRGFYVRNDGDLGYVVEADAIPGLMHIYPESALEAIDVS